MLTEQSPWGLDVCKTFLPLPLSSCEPQAFPSFCLAQFLFQDGEHLVS